MSRKSLVNDFKCLGETYQFNKGFIKSYHDDSDEEYFLEFDVQYPENFHFQLMIYPFYLK